MQLRCDTGVKMKLSEKLVCLCEVDYRNEVIDALEDIIKTIPVLRKAIPVGQSDAITIANKAIDKDEEFASILLKDIKGSGELDDKLIRGLHNFVSIVTNRISKDLMKVLNTKVKNTKLAVDQHSKAITHISNIVRILK